MPAQIPHTYLEVPPIRLFCSRQDSGICSRSNTWRSKTSGLEARAVVALHERTTGLGLDVRAVRLPHLREVGVADGFFSVVKPFLGEAVVKLLVRGPPENGDRGCHDQPTAVDREG